MARVRRLLRHRGGWDIKVIDGAAAASLDDADFGVSALDSGQVTGTINEALAEFDGPSSHNPYAATLTASVTFDEAEDIAFYLYASGHVRLNIDDVLSSK
ncbi:MAG: hypothetical protein AAGA70_03070 [Pseudomonadota bacterium]